MGIFDALADDDDSDVEEEEAVKVTESLSQQFTALTVDTSIEHQSSEDDEGWHLIRSPRRTRTGSEDETSGTEKPSCFICRRSLTAKFRGIEIPCSRRCNSDIQVHKKCLSQWRAKSESCPLCRAALTSEKKAANMNSSSNDDDGDIGSFIVIELDAKARRGSAARRSGKALTFKAAKQRQYAMEKRDNQRAQAKRVTFAEEDDGDF